MWHSRPRLYPPLAQDFLAAREKDLKYPPVSTVTCMTYGSGSVGTSRQGSPNNLRQDLCLFHTTGAARAINRQPVAGLRGKAQAQPFSGGGVVYPGGGETPVKSDLTQRRGPPR